MITRTRVQVQSKIFRFKRKQTSAPSECSPQRWVIENQSYRAPCYMQHNHIMVCIMKKNTASLTYFVSIPKWITFQVLGLSLKQIWHWGRYTPLIAYFSTVSLISSQYSKAVNQKDIFKYYIYALAKKTILFFISPQMPTKFIVLLALDFKETIFLLT